MKLKKNLKYFVRKSDVYTGHLGRQIDFLDDQTTSPM